MLIQSLCHSKLILTAAIQIIINFIVEHSRHTILSQRAVQVKYLCKCCLAVYHYIVHTTIHRGHIAVFTYSSFFCRSYFKFFAQQINYIAIKLFVPYTATEPVSSCGIFLFRLSLKPVSISSISSPVTKYNREISLS